MSRWEPYFRPTTRVHDSGFGCFECGYLQIDEDTKKAARKVVIARGVDEMWAEQNKEDSDGTKASSSTGKE